MAMTLRLDENETAALREQAEREGRSMQEVAKSAVREYVDRRAHKARLADASRRNADRYSEALEALGRI